MERLGQAGVDARALGRLGEDVAEGIDALHEARATFSVVRLRLPSQTAPMAKPPLSARLASRPTPGAGMKLEMVLIMGDFIKGHGLAEGLTGSHFLDWRYFLAIF